MTFLTEYYNRFLIIKFRLIIDGCFQVANDLWGPMTPVINLRLDSQVGQVPELIAWLITLIRCHVKVGRFNLYLHYQMAAAFALGSRAFMIGEQTGNEFKVFFFYFSLICNVFNSIKCKYLSLLSNYVDTCIRNSEFQ